MSDTDEGLRIARERITGEASARTGFLDLGRLGLDELPAELFTLKHLRTLNLGAEMHRRLGDVVRSVSSIAPNRIDAQIARLGLLPELAKLSVAGTSLRTLAAGLVG
jgi:internalin A